MLGTGTLEFPSFSAAQVSPLARALFRIPQVSRVFLGPDWVNVTIKESDEAHEKWTVVKHDVFAAITDFYASNAPVVLEGVELEEEHSDTRILEDDSEAVKMIKELLETRIRPAVQEDGGDIVFKEFDEGSGIVRLQMQGACAGCPSSAVTLKQGIENMLMHYVPEVESVEEWVDAALEAASAEQLKKLEDELKERE